ncbi:MAG: response regulator [Calditrichaeota bacterium]|nr:response regulator [Calditrichota bacterium]
MSTPKILVVEDAKAMLILMKYHLKNAGFDLCTAENGLEALQVCETVTPDLIISDMMMPIMGGIEFRKKLQKNKRLRDIPFIFLTAKAQVKEELQEANLKITAYVRKPFDPDKLLDDVQSILLSKEAV